jgi:hypothetical protein
MKKTFSHLFWSHKYHKIENYLFYFETGEEKNLGLFTKNFSQKIWVCDLGSGKNLFQIPDPGVKFRIRNIAKKCRYHTVQMF